MIMRNRNDESVPAETELHERQRIDAYFRVVLASAARVHDEAVMLQVECVDVDVCSIKRPVHAAWHKPNDNVHFLSITINPNNKYPLVYRAKENRQIFDADALLFDAYAHSMARYISKFRNHYEKLDQESEIIDAMFYYYHGPHWSNSIWTIDYLWTRIEDMRNTLVSYRSMFPTEAIPKALTRQLYFPQSESGEEGVDKPSLEDTMSWRMSDPILSLEL